MKNILLILSVALSLLVGCTPSGGDAVGKLAGEVIAVHDEVMPQMGEIMQLRREVAGQIESLEAAQSADSTRIDALRNVLGQLNAAKKGMEDWMHNYETPGEDMPDAEALTYLKGEMERVSQVKSDILSSIAAAKEILGR